MTNRMSDTPEQEIFETESGLATWALLKAHFKRGALVWVDKSLDMDVVGKAVIEDEKAKVEGWMKEGKLTPFPMKLAESEPSMKCLVAQPWVLAQEV